VAHQNLMRAMFELSEKRGPLGVTFDELLNYRTWGRRQIVFQLWRGKRDGLVVQGSDGTWRLTRSGSVEAQRIVRNHRLWEMYLITHADIAPSHVDRDADHIEHVLSPDLINQLELLLAEKFPHLAVPLSPHELEEQTT